MASLAINTEPEYKNSVHQICRLCLSEESLEDLFQEADLMHLLISDFLSIMVSPEDRLSQLICSICRIRLTEFQQFWIRCQEVQGVLLSMVQDGTVEAENELADRMIAESEDHGCTCCGKIFESRQHLDNHMESHEKSTEANKHQQTFEQSSTWIPLDVLWEIKIEESQVVSSTINSADSGTVHQEEDRALPKKFFCPACGDAFSYRRDFDKHNVSKSHLKIIHAQTLRRKIIDCKKEAKVIDTDYKTAPDQSQSSSEMDDANRKTDENMIHSTGTVKENPPPFQCKICHKVFQSQAICCKHTRVVHGPKSHICFVCEVGFYHSADLRMHEFSMVHLNKLHNSATNNEMNANTVGYDEMLKRIEKRKKEKLKCKICNKVFKTAKNLWDHTDRNHTLKKFMCHPCGVSFAFKCSLRKHKLRKAHLTKLENIRLEVAQSPDSAQCTICRKVFKNKEALMNHKRQTHGPKNITCDTCGVEFRYQRDLRRHERSNLHWKRFREGRQHSVLDVADMTEIGDVKVEIRTDEQMPAESGQIIKDDKSTTTLSMQNMTQGSAD